MKWFYFKDGANPYGIYENKLERFFRMILAYDLEIMDNNHFMCCGKTGAYYRPYKKISYLYKKDALREFAKQYSNIRGELVQSWEDVAWFGNFFETYGRRYGLLREFRENGIC